MQRMRRVHGQLARTCDCEGGPAAASSFPLRLTDASSHSPLCACGSHVGHIFRGSSHPGPNQERHCVNSASVRFEPGQGFASFEEAAALASAPAPATAPAPAAARAPAAANPTCATSLGSLEVLGEVPPPDPELSA